MIQSMQSSAGRAAYAPRKQRVEAVFGIIKSVMGVCQFFIRGPDNVQRERTLIYLAWHLERVAVSLPQ